MPTAHKYMVYERDAGGTLARTHRVILLTPEDALRYTAPEPLLGWAERLVYWESAAGPCAGIAPMSAPAAAVWGAGT